MIIILSTKDYLMNNRNFERTISRKTLNHEEAERLRSVKRKGEKLKARREAARKAGWVCEQGGDK